MPLDNAIQDTQTTDTQNETQTSVENPLSTKLPVVINTVILQCPECSYQINKKFLTKFVEMSPNVYEPIIDNTVIVLTHNNDNCSLALKIDNETKSVSGQYLIPEILELEKI